MPRWWPFKRRKQPPRLEQVVDDIIKEQAEVKEAKLRERITVLELVTQATRRSVK